MSREGEAVQGAVPREEGFASVLRRDAWVKPFFFRYRKALALALFLGLLTFGFASALMFTSGYLVSASAVVETILFLHLPLMEGRLVVFATHRLHWVHDMDAVLVMEDGRVAERGTHEQLLALGGTYAHYYEMQFGPVEQGAVL